MSGGEPFLPLHCPSQDRAGRFLALSKVGQQAAPGTVSTRELARRCSIVRIKRRRYRSWRHQETFAGAARQRTLTTGKRNGLRTRVQHLTVKSGSPPGGGPFGSPSDHSAHPYRFQSSDLRRKSLPRIASKENQPGPKQRTISAARKNGNSSAFRNLSGCPQMFRTALRSATQKATANEIVTGTAARRDARPTTIRMPPKHSVQATTQALISGKGIPSLVKNPIGVEIFSSLARPILNNCQKK